MTKRTNSTRDDRLRMGEDPTDEKGNPIVSSVLYETRCEWCDCAVPVRGSGRRPRFCSPAHRVAMHRAVEAYRRALDDARRAQAIADAKVEAARLAIAVGGAVIHDFERGTKRLEAIRFAPARHETPSTTTVDADGITQAAWVYVKEGGWVDPATIEA